MTKKNKNIIVCDLFKTNQKYFVDLLKLILADLCFLPIVINFPFEKNLPKIFKKNEKLIFNYDSQQDESLSKIINMVDTSFIFIDFNELDSSNLSKKICKVSLNSFFNFFIIYNYKNNFNNNKKIIDFKIMIKPKWLFMVGELNEHNKNLLYIKISTTL